MPDSTIGRTLGKQCGAVRGWRGSRSRDVLYQRWRGRQDHRQSEGSRRQRRITYRPNPETRHNVQTERTVIALSRPALPMPTHVPISLHEREQRLVDAVRRHKVLWSKVLPATLRFCIVLAVSLGPGACGYQTPLPDTALAPDGAFGSNGDEDVAAINLASWAFSSSRNIRNRPVDAARSVAAVDYLAGELSSNPRWVGISPLVQMEMLQARDEVRASLGVLPGARSQAVVNGLSSYAASLVENGDRAQAAQYLASPIFTLGPYATEARLENLPFMRATNIATQRAASYVGGSGGANDNQRP